MLAAASKHLFHSRRRHAASGPGAGCQNEDDAEATLTGQLQELVRVGQLAPLAGTSDLPTGSSQEVADLLHRYLVAEKRVVAKAAARLQQQAEWRQQTGTVTEVRC